MPRPALLKEAGAYADDEDLKARQDLFHKAGRDIEARGTGIAVARGIGEAIAKQLSSAEPWFAVLDQPKDIHEERAIQRAIGEWADGDTVAAHIGYGYDVLCTEDQGRSAGAPSVFDAANRAWLAGTYNVDLAGPAGLAARL